MAKAKQEFEGFFVSKDPEKNETWAKYEKKSHDPDYVGYSPLQCAIYDEDTKAVQLFIKKFRKSGNLRTALEYISKGETKENVFHVAMKNLEIFKIICAAVKECEKQASGFFAQLLNGKDNDKDSCLHQIVEFGRLEVLIYLLDYQGAKDDLAAQLNHTNIYSETPLDVATKFGDSRTIQTMLKKGYTTKEKLSFAEKQLPSMQEALANLLNPTHGHVPKV